MGVGTALSNAVVNRDIAKAAKSVERRNSWSLRKKSPFTARGAADMSDDGEGRGYMTVFNRGVRSPADLDPNTNVAAVAPHQIPTQAQAMALRNQMLSQFTSVSADHAQLAHTIDESKFNVKRNATVGFANDNMTAMSSGADVASRRSIFKKEKKTPARPGRRDSHTNPVFDPDVSTGKRQSVARLVPNVTAAGQPDRRARPTSSAGPRRASTAVGLVPRPASAHQNSGGDEYWAHDVL